MSSPNTPLYTLTTIQGTHVDVILLIGLRPVRASPYRWTLAMEGYPCSVVGEEEDEAEGC